MLKICVHCYFIRTTLIPLVRVFTCVKDLKKQKRKHSSSSWWNMIPIITTGTYRFSHAFWTTQHFAIWFPRNEGNERPYEVVGEIKRFLLAKRRKRETRSEKLIDSMNVTGSENEIWKRHPRDLFLRRHFLYFQLSHAHIFFYIFQVSWQSHKRLYENTWFIKCRESAAIKTWCTSVLRGDESKKKRSVKEGEKKTFQTYPKKWRT